MDAIYYDVDMPMSKHPFCLILPLEGNIVVFTNGSYGDRKKRGRPPDAKIHKLLVGDMCILSCDTLHKIVVAGNEQAKWLELAVACKDEYIMSRQPYL